MRKRLSFLSASFPFVAANVVAGLLHYLFQVIASRRMSAAEFSQFNSWFAHMAVFFFIGGLLQYAANFFPAGRRRLRATVVIVNLFTLSLLALWPLTPAGATVLHAVMVLTGAAAIGWLTGQAQIRLLFLTIAAVNLLTALTKLSVIFWVKVEPAVLEQFVFAVFASYLPALWWLSAKMWNGSDAEAHPTPRAPTGHWLESWSAPVVLSVAGAVIPQMDLVIMSRIQSAVMFQEFARASLFYKGIYFFIAIFAQWLLPHQIRAREGRLATASLGMAALSIGGSAALTLASPLVVAWILHWESTPPPLLTFSSCLNMSLLTWIFLLIQEACAQGRVRMAAFTLAALSFEALAQLTFKLEPVSYYGLAIAGQVGLVFLLSAAFTPRIAVNISR
jgi:hypothetical protein